jgi:hypothetical protein
MSFFKEYVLEQLKLLGIHPQYVQRPGSVRFNCSVSLLNTLMNGRPGSTRTLGNWRLKH